MEAARQLAGGLGVSVSVGVISTVLEWLSDEDIGEGLVVGRGVVEWLSNEERGVVSEEDKMEEELNIGSDELERLGVDDELMGSTTDED